jgi:hypothetical protein
VSGVSRVVDRLEVTFDEPGLVANAGLVLLATLAARLGIETLVDSVVRLGDRAGAARPGRKLLTLVHALAAGGSHIDHVDMLRAGATSKVLGHRVMAPSTVGTWLRAFTFGHVRQLEAAVGVILGRAWGLGAGPGDGRLVVDIDSTICEVHGHKKAGAAYGYTRVLGYHPILATRADTGEVLHARMRKGSSNTARGVRRFTEELIARLHRAGAAGPMVIRFDSGFWSAKTLELLEAHKVGYTMAVRANTPAVAKVIAAIDEAAWTPIKYPAGGEAQVAGTVYGGRRLIVRRTRLVGAQGQLFPDWRHFAFLSDQPGTAVHLDAFHRQHAVVELAIRDLKAGAGLDHVPSGHFAANGAWLQAAVLAHNLLRWAELLGEPLPAGIDRPLVVARSQRLQLIAVPARLVNRAGRHVLRMPARWPWATDLTARLERLRRLPAPAG